MFLGFNYNDDAAVQEDMLYLLKRLEPVTVNGFGKIRVGKEHDGGYIMLDDFAGIEAAYSIGINNDISWDKQVAAYGIDIFQYDHTIDTLPEQNPHFRWSKIGLGVVDNPAASLESLPSLITRNGHEACNEMLLKFDIEDAEWDVFGALDSAYLKQFRQIVGEFHFFNLATDRPRFNKMLRTVLALTAHHSVVHVHANNCAAWCITGAVPIPSVLEFTFVRNEGKTFSPFTETFPTRLDMPNYPFRPDYPLGSFKFS